MLWCIKIGLGGPIKETDLNSIKYVDEDVVFLGALNGHYGHFILEGLSRLWYFLNPENAHLKAVYISEGSNERFISFFSLFGLKDQDIIEIIEPTRFRSVVRYLSSLFVCMTFIISFIKRR